MVSSPKDTFKKLEKRRATALTDRLSISVSYHDSRDNRNGLVID